MTGHASASEVVRTVAVSAAVVLPLLWAAVRWASARYLTPRWWRQLPLTAGFFLLILTVQPEARRA